MCVYEDFRHNVYTDVFGGSLRAFWSNVVKHMDESAKSMDVYSVFFKSFILQERQAIKAMKQSLVALKKTARVIPINIALPIKLKKIELIKLKASSPIPIASSHATRTTDPIDVTIPLTLCKIDRTEVICQRYICRCGDKGFSMITV